MSLCSVVVLHRRTAHLGPSGGEQVWRVVSAELPVGGTRLSRVMHVQANTETRKVMSPPDLMSSWVPASHSTPGPCEVGRGQGVWGWPEP